VKNVLLTVALLLVSSVARASYYCDGPVTDLSISKDGLIMASIGELKSVYLCQIGASKNGVSSEVCKAIHAQLLAATISGRRVRMYFDDSNTCTTHTAWADLTGWYTGPVLLN
jgi:hypothetical protein